MNCSSEFCTTTKCEIFTKIQEILGVESHVEDTSGELMVIVKTILELSKELEKECFY